MSGSKMRVTPVLWVVVCISGGVTLVGCAGADVPTTRSRESQHALSQRARPSRPRVRTEQFTPKPRRMNMRVFVAGATGAIGRRLVPQLVARGHQVIATTRSADKVQSLRAL